jgi:hypothetical protein
MEPSALVIERDSRRTLLQPWIDAQPSSGADVDPWNEATATDDPLVAFLSQIEATLGEVMLIGLAQGDAIMEKRWSGLIEQGEQLGLDRFLRPARQIRNLLATRRGTLNWDVGPSAELIAEFAILATFGASYARA